MCRQAAVVYMPPTQLPSAKHTTPSVRREPALKLSESTCSNRHAVPISSLAKRGQTVGSPVEPDDTATMSHVERSPPRQSSASSFAWWYSFLLVVGTRA